MTGEKGNSPTEVTAKELRAARNRRYYASLKERGVKRRDDVVTSVKKLSAELDAAQVEREALRLQQAALSSHAEALCALGQHQSEMLHVAGLAVPAEAALLDGKYPPLECASAAPPPTMLSALMAALRDRTQPFAARCKQVLSQAYYEAILRGYITVTEDDLRHVDYVVVYATGDHVARYSSHRATAARLLEQYEAGALQSVEACARRLYKFRTRCMQTFIKYRPDLLPPLLSNLTPPPSEAASTSAAAAAAAGVEPAGGTGDVSLHTRLHPSLHFVAELGWTEEQRSVLRPHWQLYKARIVATQREAERTLADVQRDAVATLSAWEGRQPKSQSQMMAAYTKLAGSTGGLDSSARLQLVAMMELGCAIVEVMTPIQALKMDVNSQPYSPDAAQICAWLLD